ncbi:MAG: class I SAM-dependent methyltransferase, partial [Rhodospirillales bacterium]
MTGKRGRVCAWASLPGETLMTDCRICGTAIEPFMTFGRMPIANGFLTPEDFDKEYFFELAPAFCPGCGMVQIVDQPEPQLMFHENYAFFSS